MQDRIPPHLVHLAPNGIRDAAAHAASGANKDVKLAPKHVFVEAGGVAGELYQVDHPDGRGMMVDELMLSIYEEPEGLHESIVGATFPFKDEVEAATLFPHRGGGEEVFQEESGRWRFMRFWR